MAENDPQMHLPTHLNQKLSFIYNPNRRFKSQPKFSLHDGNSQIIPSHPLTAKTNNQNNAQETSIHHPKVNNLPKYHRIIQRLSRNKEANCNNKYCCCKKRFLSIQHERASKVTHIKKAIRFKSQLNIPDEHESKYKVMKILPSNSFKLPPIITNTKQANITISTNKQQQNQNSLFAQNKRCEQISSTKNEDNNLQYTFNPQLQKKATYNGIKTESKTSKSRASLAKLDSRCMTHESNSHREINTKIQAQSSNKEFTIRNQLPSFQKIWNIKNSHKSLDPATYTLFSSILQNNHKFRTVFSDSNNWQQSNSMNKDFSNSSFLSQLSYNKLPNPNSYSKFIRQYKALKIDFDLSQIIKKNNFTIQRYNNAVYFGEMKDKMKHGQGVLIGKRHLFEGFFQNNEKKKGVQKNKDGIYIGSFLHGKRQGKGIYKWNNGQYFEGYWRNGAKNGQGSWFSPKGDSYIGGWHQNKQQGYGTFKHHKRSTYTGSFLNFLKHGQGSEKFANGDCYNGEYRDGKPNGKGEYKWKQGHIYEGNFVQGYRQGFGKLIDIYGNIYLGNFINDQKNGKGKQIFKTGEIFIGDFENGLKKKGKLFCRDGSQIEIVE